jgi:WD40 repeat protein
MTMTRPSKMARRADNRPVFALMLLGLLLVGGVMLFFMLRMTTPQTTERPLTGASQPEQQQPAAQSTAVLGTPIPEPQPALLLAWRGMGPGPGQQSAAEPGELVAVDASGASTSLLALPPQTSRVGLCGDGAVSPDGRVVAVYVGLDAGELYLFRGAAVPQKVDEVQALACLGGGTFQFAPDGGRFGYIAFEPDARQSEFPDGFLKIYNTADAASQFTYENVAAFDLTNSGTAFISFFTNDRGEADEAAVLLWDGASEREIATLQPTTEDCRFTSASVKAAADGQVIALLGQRCPREASQQSWQLFRINPVERSAVQIAANSAGGAFAAFARAAQVMLSPDGGQVIFTVPDGRTANTAALYRIGLADSEAVPVIQAGVVMPTYNGADQATPQLSPDGRWLAVVVTNTAGDAEIQVINLADAAAPAVTQSAGSAGDSVSLLRFSPDGSRVLAVIGGDAGANNALITLDLASGAADRLARGRFGAAAALSLDGLRLGLLDWQVVEDPNEPPYANTIILDVNSAAATPLYTGAEIIEGKVENQSFLAPLAWLPS